jgi:nucleoside 2-deoxyribosyltransferase
MKKIDEAHTLAHQLKAEGHTVHVPETTQPDVSKREHIDVHFEKLQESDGLIVGNFIDEATDQYGRVGASTFFEVGWAYALNKQVYYVAPLDPDSPFTEDIEAIANGSLQQLKEMTGETQQ